MNKNTKEYQKVLLSLNHPTKTLLAAGGDDRLDIDWENYFNSYGCAPVPAIRLTYSYSTASTVSMPAYNQLTAIHRSLKERTKHATESDLYKEKFTEFRHRIDKLYKLPAGIDIIFSPSGTDLEYIVLALSIMSREEKTCNIILGTEEVGTGIKYVSKGQYCKPRTVFGTSVKVGETLPGFQPENICTKELNIRYSDGAPKSSNELITSIKCEVEWALSRGFRPLIHIIYRSKTGLIAPDWELISAALGDLANKIDFVVDACQGRISPEEINKFLNAGVLVLFTGSKFFGGAPFSGVLFAPINYRERLQSKTLPRGLEEFSTKDEWPPTCAGASSVLPDIQNWGLVLRWESALFEMERFFSIPHEKALEVSRIFEEEIRWMCSQFPCVSLINSSTMPNPGMDGPSQILDSPMIHTLALFKPGGTPVELDEAQDIYKLLYSDISVLSPCVDREVTETIIHLGQPVKCWPLSSGKSGRWQGTLRISLGAPVVSDAVSLSEESMRERFKSDMSVIGRKIRTAVDLLPNRASGA